jgi:hypothetical protein
VLPSAAGQEAVVTAGHYLRAVGQRDAVRGLDRAPVRQHLRAHEMPVRRPLLAADDLVAHVEVGDGPLPPIRHQDARVP